jgi:hypothetical protein
MGKKLVITGCVVLVAGLLCASLSSRYVSRRASRNFVEGFTALDHETRPIVLNHAAVGATPIPSVLLAEPAVLRRGPLSGLLGRRERLLPARELAIPRPRVWVVCRSMVAGPFLLVTDLDGAWELRGATDQAIERSLRLAFGSSSLELSSWRTGAMYHGASN